ncbi:MAG: putative DNA binding domain-containing protein [Firmicutes bacterium]|nr:putative DNA binding domain-containing protein [Bacillota bacterium]
MKESKDLEFNEIVNNSFLKTVSAFANYDGGTIIFGIDDSGRVVGLDDPEKVSLDIENRINDSISPHPDYTIGPNKRDRTITLTVRRGFHLPYLYKAKAYKRNGTSTIETDHLELTRLILEGKHMSYEELPSEQQSLSFSHLGRKLKEQMGLSSFNADILKTLNLYSDETGYNNAAAVLSDDNAFPGIDIAKFGDTISIIKKRRTVEHLSILQAYDEALEMYRDYYMYEEIDGAIRKQVETIPESAFREAVANAVIHRTWDVNARIRVFMFDDRIEIYSPGGLPRGITEDEYVEGQVSVLRNPILANVFNRLNLIEAFGTGVFRIKEAYKDSVSQPVFDVYDNSIRVTLPLLEHDLKLTRDEKAVYDALSKTMPKQISEVLAYPNITFGRSKVSELLHSLSDKGIVTVEGNGRGTKYKI